MPSPPSAKRINVIVKPGSKQPGITYEGETLVLRIRERPIEGAANAACIKALAKEYNVPPSAITLIRGEKARKKIFAVSTQP
jgi:uncharacterized protein